MLNFINFFFHVKFAFFEDRVLMDARMFEIMKSDVWRNLVQDEARSYANWIKFDKKKKKQELSGAER